MIVPVPNADIFLVLHWRKNSYDFWQIDNVKVYSTYEKAKEACETSPLWQHEWENSCTSTYVDRIHFEIVPKHIDPEVY